MGCRTFKPCGGLLLPTPGQASSGGPGLGPAAPGAVGGLGWGDASPALPLLTALLPFLRHGVRPSALVSAAPVSGLGRPCARQECDGRMPEPPTPNGRTQGDWGQAGKQPESKWD